MMAIAKRAAGYLLLTTAWVLDHLEWVTHPGRAGELLVPLSCRFVGHRRDLDDNLWCSRCWDTSNLPHRCIKCGEKLDSV